MSACILVLRALKDRKSVHSAFVRTKLLSLLFYFCAFVRTLLLSAFLSSFSFVASGATERKKERGRERAREREREREREKKCARS